MHTHPPGAAHAIGTALKHTRAHLCSQIDALAAEGDAAFTAGWDRIVAATEAAFRHEESLMELANYAGLAAHRAENARTLGALHHATPAVEAGAIGTGRAALRALAAIVASHRYAVAAAPAGTHRLKQRPGRR